MLFRCIYGLLNDALRIQTTQRRMTELLMKVELGRIWRAAVMA
jgi:hypothetical protein